METHPDFKELLALFNGNHVDYVIVGAHALAFHGSPRYTGDLDVLLRPDPQNAEHVVTVLDQFGFGSLDLSVDDFVKPDNIVQLGRPPLRIDLMTSISGVTWEQASNGAAAGKYDDIPVRFLGREQYIANKRATGRAKDLADIEALDGE